MIQVNHTGVAPFSVLRLFLLSCGWALAMMASAIINLYMLDRVAEPKSQLLVIFFGLGALIAFPVIAIVMRRVPMRWTAGQRFALAFIGLSLMTIGITAFIFALHFRAYFAQWHDHELTVRLAFQTVFTILSAIYQFLVLGLRLYIPIGLIALMGASWAFATKRI
ncbi:MAG: hypothetical protein ACRCU5_12185 [Rhizobiaceae bacterium]